MHTTNANYSVHSNLQQWNIQYYSPGRRLTFPLCANNRLGWKRWQASALWVDSRWVGWLASVMVGKSGVPLGLVCNWVYDTKSFQKNPSVSVITDVVIRWQIPYTGQCVQTPILPSYKVVIYSTRHGKFNFFADIHEGIPQLALCPNAEGWASYHGSFVHGMYDYHHYHMYDYHHYRSFMIYIWATSPCHVQWSKPFVVLSLLHGHWLRSSR